MAVNKKSFVLYCDLIHTVEKLPKNKQADLFMTILKYVNDQNPKVDDLIIGIAFEPIKQQLKRDLKNWEANRSKRIEAGKKGGINSGKSRKKEANEASASKSKQKEANEAVNGTVNGTVNVTVDESAKKINNIFFEFFRRAAGSHITDAELWQEIGKFQNKYPNIHPNKSGGLINKWVSNMGKGGDYEEGLTEAQIKLKNMGWKYK